MTTIDWPPPARPKRARVVLLAIVALLFLGGGTMVSYYVDSLWYASLGFEDVFWTSLQRPDRDLLRLHARHVRRARTSPSWR